MYSLYRTSELPEHSAGSTQNPGLQKKSETPTVLIKVPLVLLA